MPTVAAESIAFACLSVPLPPVAVAGLFHRVVEERVAAARVAAERVAVARVAAEPVVAEALEQSNYQSQPHFPQPPRTPSPLSASSSMPSQQTCPCPDHDDAVDQEVLQLELHECRRLRLSPVVVCYSPKFSHRQMVHRKVLHQRP